MAKKYKIARNFLPLGNYLKDMREAKKLSQREVSDKLGYSSAQFISNFERGIAAPPLRKLKVLIDLYGLSLPKTLDLMLLCEKDRIMKGLSKKK